MKRKHPLPVTSQSLETVFAQSAARSRRPKILVILGAMACLLVQPLSAADEPAIAEKAQEVAKEKASAAAEQAKDMWQQIEAARLVHRTPDEIVAWAIIGVLVASVAGMLTSLPASGFGRFGRLLLGLAGSFIGGVVVRIRHIDFGWGPVLIHYEELLFSFLGAVVIVLLPKLIKWRLRKKVQPK
jgi:uncharacterized membrane protein YeaQ/YmgE (transglycosylase-associated protein family)